MHADRGAEFIRDLDATGADVLVLAGDITMARDYEDLENVFKPLAPVQFLRAHRQQTFRHLPS